MSIKILFLEDNSRISKDIIDTLASIDIKVDSFRSGNLFDLTELNYDSFDCIIVDLNLPVARLTDDEVELSSGGNFTGWIWLYYHIVGENIEDKNLKKAIIYSAYINEFNDSRSNMTDKEKQLFDRLNKNGQIIRKSAPIKDIVDKIIEIQDVRR